MKHKKLQAKKHVLMFSCKTLHQNTCLLVFSPISAYFYSPMDKGLSAPTGILTRAGANYFGLVWPLHVLKHEHLKLGGSGGMLPQENFFKIRHSEIASEAMFGPKKATRISPSVVSVAREAIEPNCQK